MGISDRLHGKAALVTGASSGIGQATARELAAWGADVAVSARRTERLTDLVDSITDEHGVETLVHPADVTEPTQVEEFVAAVVDSFAASTSS